MTALLKEKLFKKSYFDHYDKVYNYAFRYLRNEWEAENIAQEVYLSLWERIDYVLESDNLLPQLYLTARWKCLNVIRDRKYDNAHSASQIHTSSSIACLALKEQSSYLLHQKEVQHLYHMAMESMPEDVRKTFLLSRESNLKYREIAQEMGISQKTVEFRINRAFKVLRRYLKDYIPVFILSAKLWIKL